jgi:hypothetical protein
MLTYRSEYEGVAELLLSLFRRPLNAVRVRLAHLLCNVLPVAIAVLFDAVKQLDVLAERSKYNAAVKKLKDNCGAKCGGTGNER